MYLTRILNKCFTPLNKLFDIVVVLLLTFPLFACSKTIKIDFSYENIEMVDFVLHDSYETETIMIVNDSDTESLLNVLKTDFDLTKVKNGYYCSLCRPSETEVRLHYKKDKYSAYFSSGEIITLGPDYLKTSTGDYTLKNYEHNRDVIADLYTKYIVK